MRGELKNPPHHDRSRVEAQTLLSFRTRNHLCKQYVALEGSQQLSSGRKTQRLFDDVPRGESGPRNGHGNRDGDGDGIEDENGDGDRRREWRVGLRLYSVREPTE